ncbi:hypothetical protein ACWGJQ_14790 [Peribacillus simplex]
MLKFCYLYYKENPTVASEATDLKEIETTFVVVVAVAPCTRVIVTLSPSLTVAGFIPLNVRVPSEFKTPFVAAPETVTVTEEAFNLVTSSPYWFVT